MTRVTRLSDFLSTLKKIPFVVACPRIHALFFVLIAFQDLVAFSVAYIGPTVGGQKIGRGWLDNWSF